MRLLSESHKSKLSLDSGYLTHIMYLSPHTESGVNLCYWASPACIVACLGHSSGLMITQPSRQARINRSTFLRTDPQIFHAHLIAEIYQAEKRARKKLLELCVRLNGSSDIDWLTIISYFPHIQFYDCTKSMKRMIDYLQGKLPANYHLTFSRTELNREKCKRILAMGGNVAAVFAGDLPAKHAGYDVIDGDLTDLRFLDPPGVVVGLRAKGKAKKDTSGFVVRENKLIKMVEAQ